MLGIVLLLVLAAFGLLVVSLSTDQAVLWAWCSVILSVVAGALLLVDWARRRRAQPEEAAEQPSTDEEEPVAEKAIEEPPAGDEAVKDDAEPAEEETDAADALTIADLSDEVRVVDERPRYHLKSCAWLAGRPTLGLPAKEARVLGFTPCALCTPDKVLAAKHRVGR